MHAEIFHEQGMARTVLKNAFVSGFFCLRTTVGKQTPTPLTSTRIKRRLQSGGARWRDGGELRARLKLRSQTTAAHLQHILGLSSLAGAAAAAGAAVGSEHTSAVFDMARKGKGVVIKASDNADSPWRRFGTSAASSACFLQSMAPVVCIPLTSCCTRQPPVLHHELTSSMPPTTAH